jgi:ribosomal protein L18
MRKIERELQGRRVVSYYTSFIYPVAVEDADADMLDTILQAMDLSRGLTLILSSPGGDGLAAERIINVCRAYSNDDFEVIVPKMAKSAATMICLGARRIRMSSTSELGPIDPQVPFVTEEGDVQFLPANVVIETYEELLQQAVDTTGRIEPYLMQLNRYDARIIRAYREAQELGKDIAQQALASGMMQGHEPTKIVEAVMALSDLTRRRSHGRAIFWKEAQEMGLNVEHVENRSPLWLLVSELHQRSDYAVSSRYAKIIETCDHEFGASAPRRDQ